MTAVVRRRNGYFLLALALLAASGCGPAGHQSQEKMDEAVGKIKQMLDRLQS